MVIRDEGSAESVAGIPATDSESNDLLCQACNSGTLGAAEVKAAIWHGADLVVVEDVPAYVCDRCGEQYYQDETAMVLDMMRGDGFDRSYAIRKMDVPVFGFGALGPVRKSPVEQRANLIRRHDTDVAGSK